MTNSSRVVNGAKLPVEPIRGGIHPTTSERLRRTQVLVAGLGNIGSFLAVLLAPLVGQLRLIDRDRVEEHNALNQFYGSSSVGQWKVDTMAAHLRRSTRSLSIETHANDLHDLTWGDVADTDVCFGALDSLYARQSISEKSYRLGIPYIDGAVGDPLLGRVQVLLPGRACLECSWGDQQYRQISWETPCIRDLEYQPRTLSPACAGATVAGLMVGQFIRLFSGVWPDNSYELTGDIAAGKFVSATRRLNQGCRFSHDIKLNIQTLPIELERATIRDLIEAAERFNHRDAVVFEFRTGILPVGMFGTDRFASPSTLNAISNMRLVELGLTRRDHVIARGTGNDVELHLRFASDPLIKGV